ncbi:cytochrome P450 [Mycena olivaceomarginata]|nr:cytochrome P450 [Mycena olivaceomarginata]
MLHEAYVQRGNGIFRLPALFRWTNLISTKKHISEIASATGALNFLRCRPRRGPFKQTGQLDGTSRKPVPYPGDPVGLRNISQYFPQMHDELVQPFDESLALQNHVPVVSSLAFRFAETRHTWVSLTTTASGFSQPRRYSASALTSSIQRCSPRNGVSGTVVEKTAWKIERVAGREWSDRPNDLVSWLLDFAEGYDRTVEALVRRILTLNLAANSTWMVFLPYSPTPKHLKIHQSMTAALYDLAKYPEYMLPMREEAERVVAEQGWTRRSRMKVSNFSDGTTIPYGSFLTVPGNNVNSDPAVYPSPEIFDGFRFSRMREEHARFRPSQETQCQHMVTTGPNHVVYGHGRHACPGRFFAATQLKTALPHVLINYDIKAETDGVRPPDHEFIVSSLATASTLLPPWHLLESNNNSTVTVPSMTRENLDVRETQAEIKVGWHPFKNAKTSKFQDLPQLGGSVKLGLVESAVTHRRQCCGPDVGCNGIASIPTTWKESKERGTGERLAPAPLMISATPSAAARLRPSKTVKSDQVSVGAKRPKGASLGGSNPVDYRVSLAGAALDTAISRLDADGLFDGEAYGIAGDLYSQMTQFDILLIQQSMRICSNDIWRSFRRHGQIHGFLCLCSLRSHTI